METVHLTSGQIEAGMDLVSASPKERGRLEAIVIRPRADEREVLKTAHLSPEGGVKGDRWAASTSLRLPDGSPDPRTQVSLMNARILRLVAVTDDRVCLAGDNLIVDLDLSETNVPVGQKLAIGDTVLQVTDIPHTGCGKFVERFGADATRFINAASRKSLHLRGRYARVLKTGAVNVGDTIRKVN